MRSTISWAVFAAFLFGAVILPGCTSLGGLQTAAPAVLATRIIATATRLVASEQPATATALPVSATLQPQNTTTAPIEPAVQKPTKTAEPTGICERAAPGNPIDISIPDDTELLPGEAFTKIWRLENAGLCVWTTDYAAELFSGQSLGETTRVGFVQEVAPGESVDISVDMVAPEKAGKYQSNWKLRSPNSQWFGIGPDGTGPFWVKIIVIQLPTDTPVPPTIPPPTPETPAPTPETNTPTPEIPPIHASGNVEIELGDVLDLDEISKNAETGSDLVYQAGEDGRSRLKPSLESVLLAVFGPGEPGIQDCMNANLANQEIVLSDIPVQATVCYRTDQGLPGRMIIHRDDLSDQTLSLDILTWSLP